MLGKIESWVRVIPISAEAFGFAAVVASVAPGAGRYRQFGNFYQVHCTFAFCLVCPATGNSSNHSRPRSHCVL